VLVIWDFSGYTAYIILIKKFNTIYELYIPSEKEKKGEYARVFKEKKNKNGQTGAFAQKKKG